MFKLFKRKSKTNALDVKETIKHTDFIKQNYDWITQPLHAHSILKTGLHFFIRDIQFNEGEMLVPYYNNNGIEKVPLKTIITNNHLKIPGLSQEKIDGGRIISCKWEIESQTHFLKLTIIGDCPRISLGSKKETVEIRQSKQHTQTLERYSPFIAFNDVPLGKLPEANYDASIKNKLIAFQQPVKENVIWVAPKIELR